MNKGFAEQWRLYREACYGNKEIDKIQEAETRQAFYAGALVSMQMFLHTSDNYSQKEATAIMENFYNEVVQVVRERVAELKGRQ